MCKELKRLKQLEKCQHLNKTDRDALSWAIQQLAPDEVEPEKGFNGFDFSGWPCLPSPHLWDQVVKARKAKKKVITNQALVDSVASVMHQAVENGYKVDQVVQVFGLSMAGKV